MIFCVFVGWKTMLMKYNKLVMKCKKVSSEEERLVGAKNKNFFEIICVETFFEATSKKKKAKCHYYGKSYVAHVLVLEQLLSVIVWENINYAKK